MKNTCWFSAERRLPVESYAYWLILLSAYYAVVADKSAYAIYSFACIYAFLQLLKLIYQLIRETCFRQIGLIGILYQLCFIAFGDFFGRQYRLGFRSIFIA